MRIARLLRQAREAARVAGAVALERFETGLVFNPLSARARQDPYPLYARLRRLDPVHRNRAVFGWLLFRHADCLEVLRDPRFSADDRQRVDWERQRAWAIEDGLAEADEPEEPVMLRRDPPDHTRLRSLVNKAFSARAVEKLGPRIEQVTQELLERLAGRDSFDLMEEFAVPLPVTIIAEMLGVPARDRGAFKRWSDHLVGFLDPNASPGPEALKKTTEEFYDYMTRIADQRRRAPADDLLSALVLAEEGGERLSEAELMGTLALLLAAGNETTTNLIGNGMLALLRWPEQLSRLRDEPELIGRAVEELLRWDSPVQFTMRIPTEPLDFRGQRFEKGQAVVLVLASANRDPAVFEDPERLDITRRSNPHLSFGHGIHFCLGAQLARVEGRIALGALVRRFPELSLQTERLRWRRFTFLRGLEALPLVA